MQALRVVRFPGLTLPRAWALAPVSALYVSNVGFALMGLQNLNIPMCASAEVHLALYCPGISMAQGTPPLSHVISYVHFNSSLFSLFIKAERSCGSIFILPTCSLHL